MGLADDLAAIEPTNHVGRKPLYDRTLEQLDEIEQAAFLTALKDPDRVSGPQLSRALRKHNIQVGESSIRKWRREEVWDDAR